MTSLLRCCPCQACADPPVRRRSTVHVARVPDVACSAVLDTGLLFNGFCQRLVVVRVLVWCGVTVADAGGAALGVPFTHRSHRQLDESAAPAGVWGGVALRLIVHHRTSFVPLSWCCFAAAAPYSSQVLCGVLPSALSSPCYCLLSSSLHVVLLRCRAS
jgi:hypothetical protein